jgi:hypothetical protein
VLLGQAPTPVQFAGGALILAGVTLVRLDELRSPPPAPSPAQSPVRPRTPQLTDADH